MKQGWEIKKLGEICGFVRGPFGGSLKKNIFKSDGYAVYEQQHAIYDQFDDIRYFIDENKFKEMKRFELNSGDLIMSCSGTMGKIAIVPENIKKGIINQALLKLTPSKKISTVFFKVMDAKRKFSREFEGIFRWCSNSKCSFCCNFKTN
jgi:type I restriction enzyme, S subunit